MRARSQPNYCMNDLNRETEKKGVVGKLIATVFAFAAGAVNALFGGGGGLLIVPALEVFGDIEKRRSHATAVSVMLPLSLCSAIVLTARGICEMSAVAPLTTGTAFGGLIGAVLLKKAPTELLSFLFYGVMIYVGIKYLG